MSALARLARSFLFPSSEEQPLHKTDDVAGSVGMAVQNWLREFPLGVLDPVQRDSDLGDRIVVSLQKIPLEGSSTEISNRLLEIAGKANLSFCSDLLWRLGRSSLHPTLRQELRQLVYEVVSVKTLNALAGNKLSKGKYGAALQLYNQAFYCGKNTLGPDWFDQRVCLLGRAKCLYLLGSFEASLHAYEAALIALAGRSEEFPNHQASIWESLADCHLAMGNYSMALEFYSRALGGEGHGLKYAVCLSGMAQCHAYLGNEELSRNCYLQALDIKTTHLGCDHLEVVKSICDLAACNAAAGNYVEALALHSRALTIRTRALGEDHPDVAESFHQLAQCHVSMGRYSEALTCHTRALDIRKRALGEYHLKVAESYSNRVRCHIARGAYAEALTEHHLALKIEEVVSINEVESAHLSLPIKITSLRKQQADIQERINAQRTRLQFRGAEERTDKNHVEQEIEKSLEQRLTQLANLLQRYQTEWVQKREKEASLGVIGAATWHECLGDVGIEPPLPVDIADLLESPCPLIPGKRVRDTHVLVLVPKTINGVPHSVALLHEMTRSSSSLLLGWDLAMAEHGLKSSLDSHWVLMSTVLLPNSTGKTWEEQGALVKDLSERSLVGYEIANFLDLITSCLLTKLKTGNELFGGKNASAIRLQEQTCGIRLLLSFSPDVGLSLGKDIDTNRVGPSGIVVLRELHSPICSGRHKTRLLIEDSDFSFAAALIRKHDSQAGHVYRTSLVHSITAIGFKAKLEYCADCEQRETAGGSGVEALCHTCREMEIRKADLNAKGVRILWGVESKFIHRHPQLQGQRFSRIHWNCPHDGSDFRSQSLPQLVEEVVFSCGQMQKAGDRVHITLAQPPDREGFYQGCVYNIVRAASAVGYRILKKRTMFDQPRYRGYERPADPRKRLIPFRGMREFVFEKISDAALSAAKEAARGPDGQIPLKLLAKTLTQSSPKRCNLMLGYYLFDQRLHFECSTDEDSSDYEEGD